MSYSELKAFRANGDCFALENFHNSHYLPVIWDVLAERYGIVHEITKQVEKERRDNLSKLSLTIKTEVHMRLRENMQLVWDLQYRSDLQEEDYWVLMFTFDNAVVPAQHIENVAEAFDQFQVPSGYIDHGTAFAKCMRTALEEVEGIRGIALYGTSVGDDPWDGVYQKGSSCPACGAEVDDTEGDECSSWCPKCEVWTEFPWRPYNLDLDDRHWFIPTKEEWQSKEDEDEDDD